MIVTLDAQPDAVRHAVHLEPLLGVDLVGAQDGPDLVVEDLGRGARQGAQPGVAKPDEVGLERSRRGGAPLRWTSRAVKAWMWMRSEPARTAFSTSR